MNFYYCYISFSLFPFPFRPYLSRTRIHFISSHFIWERNSIPSFIHSSHEETEFSISHFPHSAFPFIRNLDSSKSHDEWWDGIPRSLFFEFPLIYSRKNFRFGDLRLYSNKSVKRWERITWLVIHVFFIRDHVFLLVLLMFKLRNPIRAHRHTNMGFLNRGIGFLLGTEKLHLPSSLLWILSLTWWALLALPCLFLDRFVYHHETRHGSHGLDSFWRARQSWIQRIGKWCD